MRRLLTVLLAVTLGGSVALQPQHPARGGAADFTLAVADEIVYSGCSSYTFALDPSLPAAAEGWYLSIEVRGPGGTLVHEDYLSDFATGEYLDRMWICSEDAGPGVYTMTGTGAWFDESYNDTPVSIDQSFSLRRPRSITTLQAARANVRPGTWVKLTSLVVVETRRGLAASQFTDVVLQRRMDGRWVGVKGARTLTNDQGEATFRFRYRRGRVTLRAKATPPEVVASVSLKVVLR